MATGFVTAPAAARRAGEPFCSGPVEATCRQGQYRFKRPGQFWSTDGDEALLCLETFWRNERWDLLFPHTAFDLSKNRRCAHLMHGFENPLAHLSEFVLNRRRDSTSAPPDEWQDALTAAQ